MASPRRAIPDRLAAALVEQSLTPGVLIGWSAREVLAEHGDDIAVHALLSRIEQAVFATLLAVTSCTRLIGWPSGKAKSSPG